MKNYIKSSRSYILREIDDNVLEEVGELVAAGVVDFVIEKNGILRKYCGKAREVTVPEIVTSIGAEAFTECPTVEKVIIPKSVKIVESWAFLGVLH